MIGPFQRRRKVLKRARHATTGSAAAGELGSQPVGGEAVAAMGTPDPGLSEAGETGAVAVADPGLSTGGGTAVDGEETPLAGFSMPPADDGMESPVLQGWSDLDIDPVGIGPDIAPSSSALEPSAIDIVGIERGPSPAVSAPATPVQTHAARETDEALPAIVASPERIALLPAPAVVESPSGPLVPPAPFVPEIVAAPLVPPAPPVPPPAALPYRRHKVGISAVQFAASGSSRCRVCNEKIAHKSVRFEYFWSKSRPPGYIHAECVVRIADHLELLQDLDFLRPEHDDLRVAVSTAKEALQRLIAA